MSHFSRNSIEKHICAVHNLNFPQVYIMCMEKEEILRLFIYFPLLKPSDYFVRCSVVDIFCRAETTYHSGAHEFTPSFQCSSCCTIFSFLCNVCSQLFGLFILVIALPEPLQFTDSDQPLVISKHFLYICMAVNQDTLLENQKVILTAIVNV